ncbi:site-specific DNA recombinase [Anaerocolumna jejuensis DSM 15929]|uniref:Site-specific DNA recombinase n=1 Tax=Anaerocolumna jejuensis DSM 15929 TaxID=1121322 RepID=A0A1M7A6J9_9FIRM|nr:recombinase family protein [Anaerocolumna jejuensis]SHL38273.1 site-specific DNA recombinase [Anaerocolumna jejuensis DSM 15929]
MANNKVKVYIYTRVSTSMQVDGYSLDAQKGRIYQYANAFNYLIAGEYEDAGKSGKNIGGRPEFSKMLEDIETNKDGVSYVLVFKLSRFGRNAADVLSSLQRMQDYNVNLICVEDGIDSSKDAGKLMISVLSAVSEIERENILVQTMEGRKQKAREGKWNGGFAPYGYKLVNGKLEVEETEAEAVRIIFNKYVNTSMGANGIAKYLEQNGIKKIERQNGNSPLFSAHLVRQILANPVYVGKIAYGRRSNQKVTGTRDKFHIVKQNDYMVFDGIHTAIVDLDTWEQAQDKLIEQAKLYEHVNKGKDEKIHLLSGLLRCPICNSGMYGNKSVKRKKDGSHYKDYYYYGCKHRIPVRGNKCTFNKQLAEDTLDDAVAEIISKLISNPKFAKIMQEKINIKTDTAEVEKEIAVLQKQLGQYIGTKRSLENQIDTLDYDDKHYDRKLSDLQDRLDKQYDKIDDIETSLKDCKSRKKSIEAEILTSQNIYNTLICFNKLYGIMEDYDKRDLLTTLIKEINVFEKEQTNGQWLKSIVFKLPIISDSMEISLDNDTHVECVVRLERR